MHQINHRSPTTAEFKHHATSRTLHLPPSFSLVTTATHVTLRFWEATAVIRATTFCFCCDLKVLSTNKQYVRCRTPSSFCRYLVAQQRTFRGCVSGPISAPSWGRAPASATSCQEIRLVTPPHCVDLVVVFDYYFVKNSVIFQCTFNLPSVYLPLIRFPTTAFMSKVMLLLRNVNYYSIFVHRVRGAI